MQHTRFHLPPFSREESAVYIGQHLKAVKAPCEIFTSSVTGVIFEYCEGIPRKINKVATA